MSLEDLFNAIKAPPTRCTTCSWYAQLEPKDKAFFDRKANENRSKLWSACRANGLDISYSSFRDHFLRGHYNPAPANGAN